MFWIEEGNESKFPGYRLYYCETEGDVSNLPTLTNRGQQDPLENAENSICKKGCEALCLDSGDVYTLRSNNMWKKLGG